MGSPSPASAAAACACAPLAVPRRDLRAARLGVCDAAAIVERRAQRLEGGADAGRDRDRRREGAHRQREKSGSGPTWITGQPSGSWWRWGSQGTMASSTRTASASASQGPTRSPRAAGASVASESRDGQNSTTGIAKRSAKSASAAKLRSVPSPRPQMINGRFGRGEDGGRLGDRLGGGRGGRGRAAAAASR